LNLLGFFESTGGNMLGLVRFERANLALEALKKS